MLAPFLFIICLDYVLRTTLDLSKEVALTLRKRRSHIQPPINNTDADYADDLANLSDSIDGATKLLHSLEEAAVNAGLYVNAKEN